MLFISLKMVVMCLFRALSIVFIYTTTMMMMTRMCTSNAMADDTSPSTELVTNVCNKTSNYKFCTDAFYSDPQTRLIEDYFTLAWIPFRLAYDNSTNTQRYISQQLLLKDKKNCTTTASRDCEMLRRCNEEYKKAIFVLGQALDELNSESYDLLFGFAAKAGHAADDCQGVFRGTRSPLTTMNGFLKGLSEICMVISKFFISSSL